MVVEIGDMSRLPRTTTFSDEALEELCEIYKRVYGEEISLEEAEEVGQRLYRLAVVVAETKEQARAQYAEPD